ncbi:MAG TPA: hypothetical protein VGK06_02330 [Methanosarcina sp.]|jgi:hypothetical protein
MDGYKAIEEFTLRNAFKLQGSRKFSLVVGAMKVMRYLYQRCKRSNYSSY